MMHGSRWLAKARANSRNVFFHAGSGWSWSGSFLKRLWSGSEKTGVKRPRPRTATKDKRNPASVRLSGDQASRMMAAAPREL
jgi:hypothetical protein